MTARAMHSLRCMLANTGTSLAAGVWLRHRTARMCIFRIALVPAFMLKRDIVEPCLAVFALHGSSWSDVDHYPSSDPRGLHPFTQVQDGVHLGIGDEVAFVFGANTKTGDRLARRVRRTKEAPPGAAAHSQHHSGPAEFVAEHNPNAMKFIGNRTKVSMHPARNELCRDARARALTRDSVLACPSSEYHQHSPNSAGTAREHLA